MNPAEYIEAIIAIVALIVWLVRLEAKTNATDKANIETQKDVDEVRHKLEGFDTKIIAQLSAVRESLARLEGRLGINNIKGE